MRRTLTLLLVVACLGLIAWTAVAAWQRSCRLSGLEFTQFGTPCPTLVEDLAPLAVAVGICAIILLAEALNGEASVTEFVAIAGILATGKLALMGSDLAFRLNYFLLAWVPPVFFHLHIRLIGGIGERGARRLLRVFQTLAVLWSIPVLFWTTASLQALAWYGVWRAAVRLTAALAVVASVIIVTRYSRRGRSEAGRRPVRLIIFGNLAAMMPMLLLSLLPDTLRLSTHVPYEVTFFGLLISPLLYAYAMLPYRMTKLDAFLRRAAVYYLLITFLATVFLVATTLLLQHSPQFVERWPVMAIIIGALTLTAMEPLQRWLTRLTDWIWFGRSASYSSVVGRLAESLSTTLERGVLERLLVRDLANAMHLSWSALYMRGRGEVLAPVSRHGAAPVELADTLPADGALARDLETRAEPLRHENLHAALASTRLRPEERAILDLDGVALWLPLVSGGVLHGILLLGPKAGDDFFTPQDYDILSTLAYQSGIAAHNVRLVDQVSAGRQELARAHRQLLDAGEQERRRLAQELHDGAVQQLIGISYQLAASHRRTLSHGSAESDDIEALLETLETTRQEVLDVATQLRGMIGELRPPGLEELGLAAALHGYVSRLRREYGDGAPEIELDLNDGSAPIPIPVALCLFRVAQEGMRNALKHAGASHVTLRLSPQGEQLSLTVRDDGVGFEVPRRLSELAAQDHFGLVSIAERVAQVGGELTIRSDPGAGSEIIVHIDVNQERDDGQLAYQGVVGG
jgi:signal transduction histidine kinase